MLMIHMFHLTKILKKKAKYLEYPNKSTFNNRDQTVPCIFGYRSLGEFRRYVKHYLHNTSNSYVDFLYTLYTLFADNRLRGHDAKYVHGKKAHPMQGFFFDINTMLKRTNSF